jgi:hypothetical protein
VEVVMGVWNHNAAILPCLKAIVENTDGEAEQWIILESLCLGIGKLHGRTARETAVFIETMAERLATGERQ